MKRNLVHRSSVSGADSGSAVFQARCLSKNTSIFTWISSKISSSLAGWVTVQGGRSGGGAAPAGQVGMDVGTRRLGWRETVPSAGIPGLPGLPPSTGALSWRSS